MASCDSIALFDRQQQLSTLCRRNCGHSQIAAVHAALCAVGRVDVLADQRERI